MEEGRASQLELLHYTWQHLQAAGYQEHLLRLPYPNSCAGKRGGKPSHTQVGLELNTPKEAPASAVSPSCTEFTFALPFKVPHSLTQFRLRFSPISRPFPLVQI